MCTGENNINKNNKAFSLGIGLPTFETNIDDFYNDSFGRLVR